MVNNMKNIKIKIVITKKNAIFAGGLLLAMGITAGGLAVAVHSKSHGPATPATTAAATGSDPAMNHQVPADSKDIQAIKGMAEQQGAAAAYDYLKQEWKDRQVQGHDLSHVIGRIAYQQLGDKSFAVCDSNFAFGCFHGLLEELIKQRGEAGFATATAACNKLQLSGAVASCLHGIGHGVMGYKGDVGIATATCQKFAQQERNYCYDGVYMEYYTGIMKSGAKPQVNPGDPWQFCLVMIQESQGQCVRNQILYVLYNNSAEVKSAVQSCSVLPENLQAYCTPTVGLYATQVSKGKPGAAQAVCQNFSDQESRTTCIVGAAQEFVFQHYPPATARQLCQPLDVEGKSRCQQAIEAIIEAYGNG
jgi:hypothetical protein